MSIGIKRNLDLRGFLLSNYYPGDDSNLFDRVTALEFQDVVIESLRVAMGKQLQFRQLVNDLLEYTDQEDLNKASREIISAARQIMEGDVSGMSDFKKLINSYPAIAEDENPSALKKAYARIVKAADKLDSVALEKAVDNAIDKKALSNAFRIAVTESNRAYNTGVYTQAVNDEDCVAIQIDLSTSFDNCDECIEIAETDNGAGPGIYPIDNCPAVPRHPHCACLTSGVYRSDIDPDKLESDYDGEKMEALE
jgi:hypothetical protein